MNSMRGIFLVWLRYFDVFRKNLIYGVITTFIEPFLFLASFGLGLGSLVPDLTIGGHSVTYRQFVLVGIIGQTVLFQSFFEAAYGAFVRMYYQKVFLAMATTPITLSEVLWGELLWDSFRATLSALSVLLVGSALGDFNILGVVYMVPLVFVGSLLFSSIGLLAAARASTIDELSYPQYLVVFPMFLFCGVFFPLENLPLIVQPFAWLFPLTSFLSVARSFLLDLPVPWFALPLLIGWLCLLVPWSRRAMTARVVL